VGDCGGSAGAPVPRFLVTSSACEERNWSLAVDGDQPTTTGIVAQRIIGTAEEKMDG
jgi:hypothetical protein